MRRHIITNRKDTRPTTLTLSRATAPVPVPLRLSASAQARDALLAMVASGEVEVILSNLDGSLRARAMISVEGTELRYASQREGWSVDWSRCMVCSAGECVTLTRTELRLLGALLEGAGGAVTRERLVRATWPGAAVDRRTSGALQVYIYLLRRRLMKIGMATALETVRGVGYRLKA